MTTGGVGLRSWEALTGVGSCIRVHPCLIHEHDLASFINQYIEPCRIALFVPSMRDSSISWIEGRASGIVSCPPPTAYVTWMLLCRPRRVRGNAGDCTGCVENSGDVEIAIVAESHT